MHAKSSHLNTIQGLETIWLMHFLSFFSHPSNLYFPNFLFFSFFFFNAGLFARLPTATLHLPPHRGSEGAGAELSSSMGNEVGNSLLLMLRTHWPHTTLLGRGLMQRSGVFPPAPKCRAVLSASSPSFWEQQNQGCRKIVQGVGLDWDQPPQRLSRRHQCHHTVSTTARQSWSAHLPCVHWALFHSFVI